MGRMGEEYLEQCEREQRARDEAPELLIQLKAVLGFARLLVNELEIDADATFVEAKAKGQSIGRVPLSRIFSLADGAIARAEGRG